MKHGLRRIGAALLVTAALSACAADGDVPTGMLRASDEVVDYDLFVPDDWTVDLTGGAVSAYRSKDDPMSVSVMVWNLPYADTTLDDWWETYQEEFDLIFTDFALESMERTTLDGVQAQKYTYTATLGENTYRYTQIAAIRRSSVYVMTVTELADITEELTETHQSDLDEIVEYFRWN